MNQLNADKFDGVHMGLCIDNRYQSRLVRAMLMPWLRQFFVTSNEDADHSFTECTTTDGVVIWSSLNWSKETTIQMMLNLNGPTPSQVRWMLSRFDLQTGVRTLQLFSEFDKRYLNDCVLKETTHRPPMEIMVQSRESVSHLVQDMRLEIERVVAGIKQFDR